jgi:cytochrome P450
MKDIAQTYFSDTEMFYLDLWPMLPLTLWCGVAAASTEVDRRLTTKPDVYQGLFQPMCGGPSLLDTNDHDWKYWRGLMKPGFAPGFVMSKAHHFIRSGDVFSEVLEKKAKERDIFQLEIIAMRFTLESIIKIAL